MLFGFVLVFALASSQLVVSDAGRASPKQLVLEILMSESGVSGTNHFVFLRIFSDRTVQFHPKSGQDLKKTKVCETAISQAQMDSLTSLLGEEDVKNLPSMFRSTYTPIDFNWALDMKIPRGARVQQIKLVNFYPAMAKQNNKPYPDALLRLTCGVLGLRKSLNAETPYSKEECTGVVSGLPSKLDAASATLKAEKEEIDYTRNLDVHQLDPTLPSMRLEDWLRSGPAGIEKVNWRPSPTCDLKDPEPLSTDKNDWATCVKFLFAYRGVSESAAYVEGMITVGTVRKGITGPPRFEHFGILDNGFFYRNPSWVPDFDINKLSALFRALAELSSR